MQIAVLPTGQRIMEACTHRTDRLISMGGLWWERESFPAEGGGFVSEHIPCLKPRTEMLPADILSRSLHGKPVGGAFLVVAGWPCLKAKA